MSDAPAFSTPHILEALQRVHRQRLSGELSFPYGDGLCTLTVAEGDIVALDTVTARERLVPFLKERGADPTDLLTGAPTPSAWVGSNSSTRWLPNTSAAWSTSWPIPKWPC